MCVHNIALHDYPPPLMEREVLACYYIIAVAASVVWWSVCLSVVQEEHISNICIVTALVVCG